MKPDEFLRRLAFFVAAVGRGRRLLVAEHDRLLELDRDPRAHIPRCDPARRRIYHGVGTGKPQVQIMSPEVVTHYVVLHRLHRSPPLNVLPGQSLLEGRLQVTSQKVTPAAVNDLLRLLEEEADVDAYDSDGYWVSIVEQLEPGKTV